MTRTVYLLAVFGVWLSLWYGCKTAPRDLDIDEPAATARNASRASSTGARAGAASAPDIVGDSQNDALTLHINEATVTLALGEAPAGKRQLAEEKFSVPELLRTLYARAIKPDDRVSYIVSDVRIAALNTQARTYMAVVKRSVAGEAQPVFDVFAFQDVDSANPVLAFTTYTPDFTNADIAGVQQKKYQITDNEYALAFEWKTDHQGEKTQMLCLFRADAKAATLELIFELCVYTNVLDNELSASEYAKQGEESASIETVKTWGKDLYSILVTRVQTRYQNFPNAKPVTRKTKMLYQWDGARYVLTNQLL